MRLYLSSFRMGDHPEHLAALVGGDGRSSVVIANAMDDAPAEEGRWLCQTATTLRSRSGTWRPGPGGQDGQMQRHERFF